LCGDDEAGDLCIKPPFNLSVRCDPDGNVPQIQFGDWESDEKWHDFDQDQGRVSLKAGPWYPFLELRAGVRLSGHRVQRPKATKSAQMACASDVAAGDAGGADRGALAEE
jgi:hypothetical protein